MNKSGRRQLTFSPLRAIRDQCLWCSANQVKEIVECTSVDCPFYSLRCETVKESEKAYLRAIKNKCLDCMTGSRVEVERCGSTDCSLWIFRLGTYGIK